MIAPTDANMVAISFSQFNTQRDADVVRVIQCSDLECSTQLELAALSGSLSYTTLVLGTGFMKVRFTSDSSITGTGFYGQVSSSKV